MNPSTLKNNQMEGGIMMIKFNNFTNDNLDETNKTNALLELNYNDHTQNFKQKSIKIEINNNEQKADIIDSDEDVIKTKQNI
eukprot:CAMPEP_0116889690 /NCGR_PEP_ID=MMETSP0467-20121206/225_1 /TAXON_ID=283647 /ORGANISM="Mesodinium pulex, Strain SPMC105" /LENGTH=81 /DNA_ID=CAMNT_0004556695 /DNA_START=672 /DNA_END=917 /DNA_ORIENTATION=-